jgi:anaerobic selenocysteine-containing dehydrogenase
VRWQDREAASARPAADPSAEPLAAPAAPPQAPLLLGRAPTLWTGTELEHAPSLRFLATGPQAELSPQDARAAGIESGDEIRVTAGDASVTTTARVRTGVPAGAVFVSEVALPEGPAELASAERVPA